MLTGLTVSLVAAGPPQQGYGQQPPPQQGYGHPPPQQGYGGGGYGGERARGIASTSAQISDTLPHSPSSSASSSAAAARWIWRTTGRRRRRLPSSNWWLSPTKTSIIQCQDRPTARCRPTALVGIYTYCWRCLLSLSHLLLFPGAGSWL